MLDVQSSDIMAAISKYLPAVDLVRVMFTFPAARAALDTDDVWRPLCEEHGFKQAGSRSRGSRPWKEIYASHLCVNCRRPGKVVLDANGGNLGYSSRGSALFCLCEPCFDEVHKMETWTERKQHALPGAKMRLGASVVDQMMQKIPVRVRKRKQRGS